MIEKGKSILLTLLVGISLLQSFLLAFTSPKVDPISQNEYVVSELAGTQEEVTNVLFPEQIVLHFGSDKHAVLYPDSMFYDLIYRKIKLRTFDGFHRSTDPLTHWYDYRSFQPGVEIRFKEGIPMSILQTMIQIKGDGINEPESISRIWIFTKDNAVRTFFIDDAGGGIYEASKADFIVKDVEEFVGFGTGLMTTSHTSDGKFYLPDKALPMVKYKIPFDQFTPEQLQKSLFVDPSITRKLQERDGSEIYTDGKRGLQINKDRKWMSYSDPVAPVDSRNVVADNLTSAVQFINKHGGWNGVFLASSIPQKPITGVQSFLFRQYIDSFPIVPSDKVNFGAIKVMLQKGVVSGYERSLLNLRSVGITREEASLPGGNDLDVRILNETKTGNITSVYPGYKPKITDKLVELDPVWVMEMSDGTVHLLE